MESALISSPPPPSPKGDENFATSVVQLYGKTVGCIHPSSAWVRRKPGTGRICFKPSEKHPTSSSPSLIHNAPLFEACLAQLSSDRQLSTALAPRTGKVALRGKVEARSAPPCLVFFKKELPSLVDNSKHPDTWMSLLDLGSLVQSPPEQT